MTAPRRPLIAGNWKMNGLRASVSELEEIVRCSRDLRERIDLMVCPPATLIMSFAAVADGVAIGGQDCHPEPAGAYTGDIAAEMLADLGATAVITGHSERRSYHRETDDEVRRKVMAAWRAGLLAILCVGESQEDRVGGRTLKIVGAQLQGSVPDRARPGNLVISYEPVWAIGTGMTPTPADIAEVHGFIRAQLGARLGAAGEGVRILYGGSVKPANAGELMAVPDVDGALVGGASLKAEEFLAIADAYR